MNTEKTWKRSLLSLPDKEFFPIIRNYLGEVRTPFNKHELIDRLTAFIKREDVQKKLYAFIDHDDAAILSAVELLPSPDMSSLFTIFQEQHGYLEFYHKLLNLEERLLIYRQVDENGIPEKVLSINPVLKEELTKQVLSQKSVFSWEPEWQKTAPPPWCTSVFLITLLSFLTHKSLQVKSDNTIRKKSLDDLSDVFSAFPLNSEKAKKRIKTTIQSIKELQLIHNKNAKLEPNLSAWQEFAELPDLDQLLLFWAAGIAPKQQSMGASFIQSILRNMPERMSLTIENFHIFIHIILQHFPGFHAPKVERLVDTLQAFSLIVETSNNRVMKNPNLQAHFDAQTPQGQPEIIIQPNFDLSIMPNIRLKNSIALALAGEPQSCDTVAHLALTKEGYHSLHTAGYNAEDLIKTLTQLSGHEVSQNIRYSIKSWDQEFRTAEIFHGPVLVLSQERRHMFEHASKFEDCIWKVLAPGIYLLDPGKQDMWKTVLKDAGIDPLPTVQESPDTGRRKSVVTFTAQREAPPVFSLHFTGTEGKRTQSIEDAEKTMLEQAKKKADSSEHLKELKARIKKHLVLSDEQMRQDFRFSEVNEAKGINYLGKVRLIEQALKEEDALLEIIYRLPKGKPDRILTKPTNLDKSGTELVLEVWDYNTEKERSIKVSKISLVRKLKASLFAP
ncbi:MAG: hypothetical protein ACLFR1_14670 [Spirochaetia bacterium]